MTSVTIQPLTKKLLCVILGISKNTLTRHLKRNKNEFIVRFPLYNETNRIVHKNMFIHICSQFGVSTLEIAERMRNHFPNYEGEDVKRIRDVYGLYD